MPVLGIFPIGAIENRIQANAGDGQAVPTGAGDLVGNFANPFAAAATDMAGFGDKQRAAVTLVGFAQQLMQRTAALVAQMPLQSFVGGVFPLAGVVMIDTDDVEIA